MTLLSKPPTNAKNFLIADVYGRGHQNAWGQAWIQSIYDGLTQFHPQNPPLSVTFVNFATIWDGVLGPDPGLERLGIQTHPLASLETERQQLDLAMIRSIIFIGSRGELRFVSLVPGPRLEINDVRRCLGIPRKRPIASWLITSKRYWTSVVYTNWRRLINILFSISRTIVSSPFQLTWFSFAYSADSTWSLCVESVICKGEMPQVPGWRNMITKSRNLRNGQISGFVLIPMIIVSDNVLRHHGILPADIVD